MSGLDYCDLLKKARQIDRLRNCIRQGGGAMSRFSGGQHRGE